jgi:hypothetical protein
MKETYKLIIDFLKTHPEICGIGLIIIISCLILLRFFFIKRKRRLEKERIEKERLERLEKEWLQRERLEKERLEKELLERLKREYLERQEKKRLERLEKERLEKERLEKEEQKKQDEIAKWLREIAEKKSETEEHEKRTKEILSEVTLRSFLKDKGCTRITILQVTKKMGETVLALSNDDGQIIAWIEKEFSQGCSAQQLADKIVVNRNKLRVCLWSDSTSGLPCVQQQKDSMFHGGKEEKERQEQNKLEILLIKKKNWEAFKQVLEQNRITVLYHFTDKANINSIKKHKGLFSWNYCDSHGINIPCPGGDSMSRQLDIKYNLQDYVRLSFCDDHPMIFRLQQDNKNLVLLKVKIDVVYFEQTQFSNINATDKEHTHGSALCDLQRINFQATQKHYVSKTDIDFKPHQAEVLVKTWIPINYIININNF